MIVTYIPPVKVPSTYLGAEKIRTVTLKNYYQEEVKLTIYKTNFQALSNKVNYQGLRIQMEDGLTDKDFEAGIAERVYQMLVELDLFEKPYNVIEVNEPESWDKLAEMCKEFVNEYFNLPGVDEDTTYNYVISNIISSCLYSAYYMLPAVEDEQDSGLWVISELHNTYREIFHYDWELFEDIGTEVTLKVPKEKVIIAREKTYLELLFEKVKSVFNKAA